MRFGTRFLGAALGTLLAAAVGAGSAKADVVYNFDCITNNSVANAATGEQQLKMILSDGGSSGGTNYALLKFVNDGPLASSICNIYFDDGTTPAFQSLSVFGQSAGVDFAVEGQIVGTGKKKKAHNVTPLNLPGGNLVGFNVTGSLKADALTPTQPNGVNPGEWLTLKAALYGGVTLDQVIEQFSSAVNDLRVGIHVQGFRDGGSESFVGAPPSVAVPTPSAAIGGLVLVGMLGVAGYRRRIAGRA